MQDSQREVMVSGFLDELQEIRKAAGIGGALLGGGAGMMAGGPMGAAIGATAGGIGARRTARTATTLGGAGIGALAGSALGPVGTALGGMAGGYLGSRLFKPKPQVPIQAPAQMPQAQGGQQLYT